MRVENYTTDYVKCNRKLLLHIDIPSTYQNANLLQCSYYKQKSLSARAYLYNIHRSFNSVRDDCYVFSLITSVLNQGGVTSYDFSTVTFMHRTFSLFLCVSAGHSILEPYAIAMYTAGKATYPKPGNRHMEHEGLIYLFQLI